MATNNGIYSTPPPSSGKFGRTVEKKGASSSAFSFRAPASSAFPFSGPMPSLLTLRDNRNITMASPRRRNRPSYSCTIDAGAEKEFPMFIAMADLLITPTGFSDSQLREAVCSKIQLMCGEISLAYTNKTTHLLAAHANTTKVEMARKRNLPVVTIDWIENIWNACQQNNPYIHASRPEFKTDDFPLFYNLHFVFSKRYTADSKRFYEEILTMNGGFVGANLKKAFNYFYICEKPESERIYQNAQSKEIPCITLSWIIESLARNELAKVSEFEVRGNDLLGFETTYNIRDIGSDLDSRPLKPVPSVSALDTTFEKYKEPTISTASFLNICVGSGNGHNESNTMTNFNTSFDDTLSATIVPDANSSLADMDIEISNGKNEDMKENALNSTFVPDPDSSLANMDIEISNDKNEDMKENVLNSTFVPDPDSSLADMDIEIDYSKREKESDYDVENDSKSNFVNSVAFSLPG